MRIALIGQAAFGEKVLEALLNKGENVVGVFAPPDPPDKPSGIKKLAEDRGIPIFQPQNMKDPEVYNIFVKLQPDLNVMAFVTDIIPQKILDLPKFKTIQYHPSLLPKHRGGSAIHWAIIKGETKTGLTIFWPDKGIDTGPILLQKEVEILPDDTTGSLYFNKLFPLGIEAIIEAVEMVKKGVAPRIPQDDSQATYEPLCTEDLTKIDWSKPVDEVYNLIRGANPSPGAWTTFKGDKLKIFDCSKEQIEKEGVFGEVISILDDEFVVVANGGVLHVKRVQLGKGSKIKSKDFIKDSGLKRGDVLGL
ncbi:MAG: methionyl-tRNA formyltransferase [Thermodesulfovibrionales bacterium]|nr:methionyl-tRNA formyltransferase [Thermodesulfovibrionales bacterium]